MPLLDTYLDQISLSAKSIADLEFPPPKIFSNALLRDHEITTLIRDTEPHERALFSLNPELINRGTKKEASIVLLPNNANGFGRKSMYASTPPIKQSVVARLLGNDLLQEIRKTSGNVNRSREGVDVGVLLRGAERLNEVYNVAGASEKIAALRSRYQQTARSVTDYEERLQELEVKLRLANKASDFASNDTEPIAPSDAYQPDVRANYTQNDVDSEEAEVRDLEARKKVLEERVSEMEKDLGGLLG